MDTLMITMLMVLMVVEHDAWIAIAMLIGTMRAVGATGGRPREALYLGHRPNMARPCTPAPLIGWHAVFAPAPGDRRSPLQVEAPAIARQRGPRKGRV